MKTTTNSIIEMPAWELSQRVCRREVSCAEVMQAYLDHIAKVNVSVNAIVALQDRDALMKQAEEKDALLVRGRSMGWMHGFPQAIKDMEETKGIVTTFGYRGLKDFVPQTDSLVVSRMKQAGSIIIGKTNVPEWGFGSHTFNEVYGATANPYDHSRTSGGSSGGAACALAMRMQAVADGSDYMGSLRNPAAFCNVYGFRPSWGRVPNSGLEVFANTLPTRGPMARNVSDLALLLSTLSGYEESIPLSLEDDPVLKGLSPLTVHRSLQTSVKGRKIAWLADWGGYLPMEEGILALCETALKTFSPLGVEVDLVPPPYDPAVLWNEIWLPLRHFTSQSLKGLYDNPDKRALLKAESVFEYEGGANYDAGSLYRASAKRTAWFNALCKLFTTYDYIAVPTAQVFPFDKTIRYPKEISGRPMDTYHRWMEVVIPWTLSGSPVVSVPAGFNEDGLPMGLQLVGKPRGDFDLLQLAYAYETANDWLGKRKLSMPAC